MKIICSREEADILIRNCKFEQCEFCFLRELCHEAGKGTTISHLILIEQTGGTD
jgi:hypothetical protein